MYLFRHFGRSTKNMVMFAICLVCVILIMTSTLSNTSKRNSKMKVKPQPEQRYHDHIVSVAATDERGASGLVETTDTLPAVRCLPVLVGTDGLPVNDFNEVLAALNRVRHAEQLSGPETVLKEEKILEKMIDDVEKNTVISTGPPGESESGDRYAGQSKLGQLDPVADPTNNLSNRTDMDDESPHAVFAVENESQKNPPSYDEIQPENITFEEADTTSNVSNSSTPVLPSHLTIIQQREPLNHMPIKTNRILHNRPHSYVLNVADICPPEQDVYILTIVLSTVTGFESRQAIRETWGSVKKAKGETIKTIFLLGSLHPDPNNTVQRALDKEHVMYHDIIQGSFVDAYRNLTLKTFFVLKWATTFCPQAKYVMKADDDIHVNFDSMVSDLKVLPSENLYMGALMMDSQPIRTAGKKWYVPFVSYVDNTYPDYMCGPCYIMGMDVVAKMYHEAKEVPYFFVEDVWIGLIGKRLQIPLVSNTRFKMLTGIPASRSVIPRLCPYAVFNVLHKLTPAQYRYLFERCPVKRNSHI